MKRPLIVASWIIALILAISFCSGGFFKLFPNDSMFVRFAGWGYAAWFVYVIGVVEVGGGLLVLHPRTAFFGGVLIAIEMIGATLTHLFTGVGSPLFALIYLILAIGIAWLRRSQALFLSERKTSLKATSPETQT